MDDDFKCDHCGHRISFSAGLCGQCRTGYFRYDPIRPAPAPAQPVPQQGSATGSPAAAAVSLVGGIIAVVLLVAMCTGE
jgi:hypothetical protein